MAEQIKFTEEEIQQINKLRQDVSNVFYELGQLSIEKKRLVDEANEKENELFQKHIELIEFEQTLFKTLNQKYGDGDYDPITGIFSPKSIENNVEEL
jgi:phage host-nuclease inhibitor protein Gam